MTSRDDGARKSAAVTREVLNTTIEKIQKLMLATFPRLTPGPWVVSDHADTTGCCRVEAPDAGHTVAQDIDFSDVHPIAASPESLAACVALIHGDDLQVAIDLARAALAKARGET